MMIMNELDTQAVEYLWQHTKPQAVNVMAMTVGEVCRCLASAESLASYADEQEWKITQKIGFLKGFPTSITQIMKVLESYDSASSPEYMRAVSEVGGAVSLPESILLDCVRFYTLHSTAEAEKLPFSDWFMAKRAEIVRNTIESKAQKYLMEKNHERTGVKR